MKKLLASLSLLGLLAACAPMRTTKAPDPTAPQIVAVAPGYLVVDQEPIVVLRDRFPNREATVTWRLPAGGNLRFEANGIVIDGLVKTLPREGSRKLDRPDTSQNQLFRCRTSEDRLQAACTIPAAVKAGVYAYTINAREGNRPIVVDPTLMID
ncbi:MAG: hypothetical protein N2483_09260 [Burkholderiaceae bacterium]|nr:hypothetical protein [Burkholderiaceae bacterium]